ncbi:hypothetical protein COHA_002391 [Chlorella ohadii]|uniref:Integrase catalytic domain-containing protein n=1 Tax=Chlorella ohadii TaxID=2649997 RepID=A0AAD5DXG9_9CHLO|nr:hypothetical protein COHA_002391 [Chlorella ohadii]
MLPSCCQLQKWNAQLKPTRARRFITNFKTFFNHADLGHLAQRLKARRGAPVPSAANGRQQRLGVGGAKPVPKPVPQEPAQDFSNRIVSAFKIDYLVNGEEILLRRVKRATALDTDAKGYKWLPVVALEELRDLVKLHHERSLLFKCSKNLYAHLAYNVATHMQPNTDGTPRVINSLAGLDREYVKLVLEDCIVRNDQARTKPEEADLIDLGANRDPRYRYVLVYIDHYPRHVWRRPLATKEPLQVAIEILGIWMDTQRPARLQSDSGTEFCAAVMNKLCDLYRVQFVHGSVGRPQSQGAVERANQTIKKTISALVLALPTVGSWAVRVLDVQKAVNNMPHEAHGGTFTPSQVLFGQPEAASVLPHPDEVAALLGLDSFADIHLHRTVNAEAGKAAAAPSRGRAAKAPAAGKKRSAAEAELAELSDEEEAELSDEEEAELSDDAEAWEAAAADEEAVANALCDMADGVQPLMADAETAQQEAEASTSAAALLAALPPHLQKVRQAANAAHVKERQRIRGARNGKGKAAVQPFQLGADVVVKPGKAGPPRSVGCSSSNQCPPAMWVQQLGAALEPVSAAAAPLVGPAWREVPAYTLVFAAIFFAALPFWHYVVGVNWKKAAILSSCSMSSVHGLLCALDGVFIVHHILSGTYLIGCLLNSHAAIGCIMLFFLGEVTSPVFNAFSISKELRHHSKAAFRVFKKGNVTPLGVH